MYTDNNNFNWGYKFMGDVLYHYCSMSTFYNIVSSRTIRVSNAYKMNDSKEIKLIFDMLTKHFPNLIEEVNTLATLMTWATSNDTFQRPHIFCLSSERNKLSQWRGYADDGQGIAIGFHSHYLDKLAKKYDLSKVQVDYDYERQLKKLTKLVTQYLKLDHKTDVLKISFVTALINHGIIAKHQDFQEESEWRIIYNSFSKIELTEKFRATNNDLISYYDIPLEIIGDSAFDPIYEVILGPKNKSSIYDIERFVGSYYNERLPTSIKRSTTSYI